MNDTFIFSGFSDSLVFTVYFLSMANGGSRVGENVHMLHAYSMRDSETDRILNRTNIKWFLSE